MVDQGRPREPAPGDPGARLTRWRLTRWRLLAIAPFLCAGLPVLDARADDELSRFLARIDTPVTPISVSADDLETFTPSRIGSICSEREGIRICQVPETGEVVSFTLVNSGSPHIVPQNQGVERGYRLLFERQLLQTAKVMIAERSRPEGRASHILMRTSLYFFPRKVLPTFSVMDGGPENRGVLELRLPTGEKVCFDRQTKEIIGGVLREDAAMDTNPNRFNRRFARVSYTGNGVVIRADQRGGTPEEAVVWGVRKKATITYGNRTCKVSPARLWEQKSGWFVFRFATDEALYDFLKTACKWKTLELPVDLPDDRTSCGRPPTSAGIDFNRP